MKIFKDVVNQNGQRCDVEHFDVDHFNDIPNEFITKAHAVCVHDGKMLLVYSEVFDFWGIPGGTREVGESVEQTLLREIQEETNCEVVDYKPIAYQKIISLDGGVQYRLKYLCNVNPLGEFKADTAGDVSKITWIDYNEFRDYIEKKEFRVAVVERAIEVLNKLQ